MHLSPKIKKKAKIFVSFLKIFILQLFSSGAPQKNNKAEQICDATQKITVNNYCLQSLET